jgi:hypothetical protein
MSKLEELYFGKSIKKHIGDFVHIWLLILTVIIAFKVYKYGIFDSLIIWASVLFLLKVILELAPSFYYPLWKVWMYLSVILGFFVTSMLLILIWFLIFIPIGILLKIIGKEVMNTKFKTSQESYWIVRDLKKSDFKLLEKQF